MAAALTARSWAAGTGLTLDVRDLGACYLGGTRVWDGPPAPRD
ncbi:hypothetical protein ACQB60_11365 [Actinomycetota bacterium Odt1-20B]